MQAIKGLVERFTRTSNVAKGHFTSNYTSRAAGVPLVNGLSYRDSNCSPPLSAARMRRLGMGPGSLLPGQGPGLKAPSRQPGIVSTDSLRDRGQHPQHTGEVRSDCGLPPARTGHCRPAPRRPGRTRGPGSAARPTGGRPTVRGPRASAGPGGDGRVGLAEHALPAIPHPGTPVAWAVTSTLVVTPPARIIPDKKLNALCRASEPLSGHCVAPRSSYCRAHPTPGGGMSRRWRVVRWPIPAGWWSERNERPLAGGPTLALGVNSRRHRSIEDHRSKVPGSTREPGLRMIVGPAVGLARLVGRCGRGSSRPRGPR
jgi:hypothetical protein